MYSIQYNNRAQKQSLLYSVYYNTLEHSQPNGIVQHTTQLNTSQGNLSPSQRNTINSAKYNTQEYSQQLKQLYCTCILYHDTVCILQWTLYTVFPNIDLQFTRFRIKCFSSCKFYDGPNHFPVQIHWPYRRVRWSFFCRNIQYTPHTSNPCFWVGATCTVCLLLKFYLTPIYHMTCSFFVHFPALLIL
jgi:hypothetical protein